MRSLLTILLASLLWIGAAFAQVVTPIQMRDANLTTNNKQNLITTLNTFTAPRTLTIPDPSALNAFYIQFVDTAGAVNGANTLTIRIDGGRLINGAATLVVTTASNYVFLVPSASGYSATVVPQTSGGGGSTPPGGSSGQVQYNNAGAFGGFTTSGDATINTGTGVLTLATVNANVGSFGSATNCVTFTTNAKGQITAASATTCTPALASITGLGTGVATALAINIGSAGSVVTNGGALGTPSSANLTNATGLPFTGLPSGSQDTVLGYWASTVISATAMPNCATALIYSTSTHTFSCNAGAGTGTVTTTGSPSIGQLAVFSSATSITGVTRAQPVICEINSTVAVTCNNGGSSANNGTYTTPAGALYLKIKLQGGGGGGGGSGTAGGGDGANGNPTCWNTTGAACTTPVFQASGGGKGSWTVAAGGTGGGVAGSSTCSVSLTGTSGTAQAHSNSLLTRGSIGGGGALFGGGGMAGLEAALGENGVPNSGGGGQGAGESAVVGFTGGGGGGGGGCIAYISSPAATYTYAVGAGAAGGAAGTSGFGGGNGANGKIIVEAYFN